MTPKFSDTRVLDVIGTLDVDEDGRHFITIEQKDETIVKDFDEIVNNSCGQMVAFKVVTEIDG